MSIQQTSGLSLILRLKIHSSSAFSEVASAIGEAGGDIIAVDVIHVGKDSVIRDITVNVHNDAHRQKVVESLSRRPGIQVINVSDRTFLVHLGGKIEVTPKTPVKNRDDLSRVYTPGLPGCARKFTGIHPKRSN
ncbi:hypothetical protein GCM10025857_19220 [Alicyclobacillus contaminans]|nr:hypothetical protein GCM10025857_19220 [Alicyclobacillus contaminans]